VYRIKGTSWPEHLAIALERAEGGDVIIVGSAIHLGLALNSLRHRGVQNVEIRIEVA
jgi:hypothetical protein